MPRIQVRKVEPIDYRREEIDRPVYPPAPLGVALRKARHAADLSRGEAAHRAGIRLSEWSGLETGTHTTDDWGALLVLLCEARRA